MNETQKQLPLDPASLPTENGPPQTGHSPQKPKDRMLAKSTPSDALKVVNKARLALSKLAKAETTGEEEMISLYGRGIDALREVTNDWLPSLEREHAELLECRNNVLNRRRETLHRSAKESGWPTRRLKDSDFVGCFEVRYKKERVTVRIGSEALDSFSETDGAKLFSRLEEVRACLDGFPFERETFFRMLKDAWSLAKAQGQHRDGKVNIRKLYPLVVLSRQSQDERFLKRPEGKFFTDYPMTQFVYDLARFGQGGWIADDGERLSNQTPNMSTVAKGTTILLPSLEGRERNSTQLNAVWIQKASTNEGA